MPRLTQEELSRLPGLLAAVPPPNPIVVVGDRFLCQQAAADILAALLPEEGERRAACVAIDGTTEDPDQTLARLQTYGLFGGCQVFRVTDSRLVGERDPGLAAIEERYCEAFENGRIPDGHLLLLIAETTDRRKRLVKLAEKRGLFLDLRVDTGRSKAAGRRQGAVLTACIDRVLARYGKKMQASARRKLIERTGFHPDAVTLEAEKLALYAGDDPVITERHLEAVGCRTREDAIYELSEAVGAGRTGPALTLLHRLVESGVHPLALLTSLRTHFRRLLLVRAIQGAGPGTLPPRASFDTFQKQYLDAIKEAHAQRLAEAKMPAHPYAVFMIFQKAATLGLPALQEAMDLLLATEQRIKGSQVPVVLLLESCLMELCRLAAPEPPGR